MNVSEWIGLAGLALGVGGVAINIGVMRARVSTADERIKSLEAARERMGAQLHHARAAIRVLGAIVDERSGMRRKTLTGTESEEGAPAAEPSAGSGSEET